MPLLTQSLFLVLYCIPLGDCRIVYHYRCEYWLISINFHLVCFSTKITELPGFTIFFDRFLHGIDIKTCPLLFLSDVRIPTYFECISVMTTTKIKGWILFHLFGLNLKMDGFYFIYFFCNENCHDKTAIISVEDRRVIIGDCCRC